MDLVYIKIVCIKLGRRIFIPLQIKFQNNTSELVLNQTIVTIYIFEQLYMLESILTAGRYPHVLTFRMSMKQCSKLTNQKVPTTKIVCSKDDILETREPHHCVLRMCLELLKLLKVV